MKVGRLDIAGLAYADDMALISNNATVRSDLCCFFVELLKGLKCQLQRSYMYKEGSHIRMAVTVWLA